MSRTHGLSHTPEYIAWNNARHRCFNPKDKEYSNYGARGITMCAQWRESFIQFLADMGPRPNPGPDYSLDRSDNDGSYNPKNCRWATRSEQAISRRRPPHLATKLPGVDWRDYKWRARIKRGRYISLGHYTERWDAICARKSAEFSYRNDVH